MRKKVKVEDRTNLVAVGVCGHWNIQIDLVTTDIEKYYAQIDNNSVHLYFEIPSFVVVDDVLNFFESMKDKENQSYSQPIGKFGQISVGIPNNP